MKQSHETTATDATLDQFSAIVELIYAAALEPSRWQEVGRLLCDMTNSVIGGVGIFDATTSEFISTHGHGLPPGYFELYRQTVPYNPMLPYIALSAPGETWTNSQVVPDNELFKSRFYRDFIQPLGLRDSIGIVCLKSGPRFGVLVANRAAGQPVYGDAERRLFQLLSPHVCRALSISDLLDLRSVKTDVLIETLDAIVAAVFVIDASGLVLHHNRAAEQLLKSGRVMSLRNDKLWPVGASSRTALKLALEEALGATDGARIPDAAIPLAALNGAGAGMIASLLPLGNIAAQPVSGPGPARWAVFIQDPKTPVPMPGEAFARLYKLSPAELRVAMGLATGMTVEEVADSQGGSAATVRTHIKKLFAKTDTNRQIDLVRLMLATMPPVSVGMDGPAG
jgi:DNA-binding CsgD family transcriptional regulator/PAS domain-containing protein